MQVLLAQIALSDNQTESNLARVLAQIASAPAGTDLIVFPETTLMGFPTADEIAAVAEPLNGPTLQAVQQAVRAANVAVAVGFAEELDGRFYNTTVLLAPEGVLLAYRKTHLWASDVGVFEPGSELPVTTWRGRKVGMLICFDIEFPETARALASQGAELLLVTNGNMDPYGPVHRTLMQARAMENQLFAVMVNRSGSGGGLDFAGGSMVVKPGGEVQLELGRDEALATTRLDFALLDASRRDYDYVAQRRLRLAAEPAQAGEGGSSLHIG
ncbi:carbon-nitrogen hydrolase family protein [Vogesella sp. LIG4]|uniref:carbon-nitrogen hydrolase family protein n=1 Tax=Vogesella sp. LIG4 TaxID=1192162 RepID=UPI00081F9CD9|nr:carbon-nitrogen hydrolase family protein [Vogesella sp. LIG4]SCK20725.1 (R)-amidase [Vogesella sp. LIG4]